MKSLSDGRPSPKPHQRPLVLPADRSRLHDRSPKPEVYVHPHERRRLRRDRLRMMGEDIPWDDAIDGTLAEAFEEAGG